MRQILAALALVFASYPLSAQQAETSPNASEPGQTGQFLGARETVYPSWFKTSFLELKDDLLEAQEAGKRVMLLFHQDNCPYCNAFVERNLQEPDILATLQQHFDVIELNMWGDREVLTIDEQDYTEKTFARALNVQFTPTILFLADDGSEAMRINGYYPPDKFRQVLDYLLQPTSEQSFSEYLAQQAQSDQSGSAEPTELPFSTLDLTTLHQRPGKGSRPLLLLFTEPDCADCDNLYNILLLEQSQQLLAGFDVYQIDRTSTMNFETPDGTSVTGESWSAALEVSYSPTMVFYSEDGKEVIRSEAFFRRFHTQSILDYVASGNWREQPDFQRYLSDRAEAIRHQGKDVNIWD